MYYELTLPELVNFIMDIIVKHTPNINQNDYCNTRVSSSKILCVGLIADIRNSKNHQKTLKEFELQGLEEYVLHKSQFSRRIQKLDCDIPLLVESIAVDAESRIANFPLKQIEKNIFIIDTKPIPICQNIRIPNCHLAKNHKSKEKTINQKTGKLRKKVDEDFRGFCASKREYFYGFKLNLIKNCFDLPREYSIHTGKTGDLECLKNLNFNLPSNSELLGDKAYNDTNLEQEMLELYEIKLNPIRKKNSKNMLNSDYYTELGKRVFRRPIESLFSQFDMNIHATSVNGFVIKIHIMVLGRAIQQLIKLNQLAT